MTTKPTTPAHNTHGLATNESTSPPASARAFRSGGPSKPNSSRNITHG